MIYKTKIFTVQAVQLNWKNWSLVCEFLGDIICPENPARHVTAFSDTCGEVGPYYIELTIPSKDGEDYTVQHGDFIVKGLHGFYPLKPSAFNTTYESQ